MSDVQQRAVLSKAEVHSVLSGGPEVAGHAHSAPPVPLTAVFLSVDQPGVSLTLRPVHGQAIVIPRIRFTCFTSS